MVLLLVWSVGGAAFVLWRWMSLGREQSSVAAYEAGLRQLEAAAARAGAQLARGAVSVSRPDASSVPGVSPVKSPPATMRVPLTKTASTPSASA